MPDLPLRTAEGPTDVHELLRAALPVLINLHPPSRRDSTGWGDRVRTVAATYDGDWELPVIGTVAAPGAVAVRPDGYVAWTDRDDRALPEVLTAWFGPPSGTPS